MDLQLLSKPLSRELVMKEAMTLREMVMKEMMTLREMVRILHLTTMGPAIFQELPIQEKKLRKLEVMLQATNRSRNL
jgi:hypothetical protein